MENLVWAPNSLSSFQYYVDNQLYKNLPLAYKEIAKYKTVSTIVENALYQENSKFTISLKNHFDKLLNHLKNTSEKRLSVGYDETISPKEQQIVVFNALLAFLKIASQRDKDGIRNAYTSFARARRQKYVRSSYSDSSYRGRPNLYNDHDYKYVVNRVVRLAKAKEQRKINPKPLVASKPKSNTGVRKRKIRARRKN